MSTADVVAWLRSDEGVEWSRDRALADDPGRAVYLPTVWRATGPLDAWSDPCGRPPGAAAS